MGIQASVSQLNELSRFVPFAIHNLNLEDTNTAKILVVMAFVWKVQNLFNFFTIFNAKLRGIYVLLKQLRKPLAEKIVV